MANNTNEQTFTVPATITGFVPTVDGCVSIRVKTQELTLEEKTVILSFYNAFGWIGFSGGGVPKLPKEQAEDKQKTPSKRLRAVLYVLSQQKGIKDFEKFYVESMNKIIEQVKAKLDQ